ncbi:MAG: SocA family protein [Sphaerochaeta sp.]|nr:SocA family protein [Sphaerochaeta sp.]
MMGEEVIMNFNFNERRSTQAAAFLIRRNGNKLNYMKLIKLLYLVDREALIKWQQPITGDKYYSLPLGPVVSKILDKICSGPNPKSPDYWSSIIQIAQNDSYSVTTIDEPEYDELSKREIRLLEGLDDTFKAYSQWDMVAYCHENLPEWKDPNGSSDQITIEDILKTSIKKASDKDLNFLLENVAFKIAIDNKNSEIADATW